MKFITIHDTQINFRLKHAGAILILALIVENSFSQGNYLPFKQLTSIVDGYPVLSPDGKIILFESDRTGNSELYTMNTDGSTLKQLTFNTKNDDSPNWSPDGKRIVFTSERDNSDPEIYIMDADGKNQKRLTSTPGDDSHPKFSPDGQLIIFNSARTTADLNEPWSKQSVEIFTMNTDGSDQKQITSFKTITTYPSISPDGKKIVCRKVLNSPGFNWDLSLAKRNSEVIVINMDGTGERNVSDSPAYDGWPIWQSDGKIVFSSNRSGVISKGQLFSVNADGSELKPLTDPQNSCTQHSVSNDGKYIYCQFDGTIAVLNLKP